MSNRRYIEFYSKFRNRSQFPNQSSFTVPFSFSRQIISPETSTDPICNGAIYYTWKGIDPLTTPVQSDTSSNRGSIVLSLSTGLSPLHNYYIGYNLYNNDTLETRLIIGYDATCARFILQQPFNSVSWANNNSYTILNPSSLDTIYIPSEDIYGNKIKNYSNAYLDYYIVNETLSTSGNYIIASKIIAYDFTTQYATLEKPFSVSWSKYDSYTIRSNIPCEKFTLDTPILNNISSPIFFNSNNNPLPGYIINLPIGQGNTQKNYYVGKYVYHSFNENIPPNVYPNPIVNKNIHGGGTYGLYFIKGSEFNQNTGNVQLLLDYDSNQEYNGDNIPNYDIITSKGSSINIISFSKDNFNPLNYNGSVVSQSETVCYEVSLISLILPNVQLKTGARSVFYPFFYIELSNITSPSGASNDIIYSNNPYSSKALFLAPVTDSSQPINSNFIKIYSNMSQTIKFKPNDSFKFSIYLPDGRPFETAETDYLSPYSPHETIQIDAVFGIKRI